MSRWILSLSVLLAGCAYQLGYSRRALPGGYDSVAIPVFQNRTPEVGIESQFTNAMIKQFERSQVAHVTSKALAPVVLEGSIDGVEYVGSNPKESQSSKDVRLPTDTVLNSEYRVLVRVSLRLVRNSDRKIIWSSTFNDEKVYSAPQIGLDILNSADALYNHTARQNTIGGMAQTLMAEAHDRMTENF